MISYFKAVLLTAAVCSAKRIRLNNPRDAAIVKLKIDPWSPDGYKFGYQTSFGSSRSESGYLKIAPDGRHFLATKGEFSYYGPDRKFYRVKYVADENGYRPIDLSLVEKTRSRLIPAAIDNDYFIFPDDETISSPAVTATISEPPDSTDPSMVSTTEHGIPGSTVIEEIIDVPVNATLGDRFGALPPGLVGSLLG